MSFALALGSKSFKRVTKKSLRLNVLPVGANVLLLFWPLKSEASLLNFVKFLRSRKGIPLPLRLTFTRFTHVERSRSVRALQFVRTRVLIFPPLMSRVLSFSQFDASSSVIAVFATLTVTILSLLAKSKASNFEPSALRVVIFVVLSRDNVVMFVFSESITVLTLTPLRSRDVFVSFEASLKSSDSRFSSFARSVLVTDVI